MDRVAAPESLSARSLAAVLAILLSLALAGCGGAERNEPLTLKSGPTSLAEIMISADTVFIAEYCVSVDGLLAGKKPPPTAKQTLFERQALQSLRIEAETHPDQTYRGRPLRVQLAKLARILAGGRCDLKGAALLHTLSQSLPSAD